MPVSHYTSGVKASMVVDTAWLSQHLKDKDLVIVDARSEDDYEKGHIPGAISLDPNVTEGLRTAADADLPLLLESADILGQTFSEYGISNEDHIVVYADDGTDAGFLLSIFDYTGAGNISLLNGGMAAWIKAGYEVSDEETDYDEKTYEVKLRREFMANNDFVKANLDNPAVIIVDVRILQQSMGMLKHPLAARAGRIPGSIQFPVFGLFEDHSGIKSPEELLFVLKERNIPKHKTIVITCNTGGWAGAAQFLFRYLGYPDVRVHDESWIGWQD